jgi:hypothetical protein
MWGSNPRPRAHKTRALPTELTEQINDYCGVRTHACEHTRS